MLRWNTTIDPPRRYQNFEMAAYTLHVVFPNAKDADEKASRFRRCHSGVHTVLVYQIPER